MTTPRPLCGRVRKHISVCVGYVVERLRALSHFPSRHASSAVGQNGAQSKAGTIATEHAAGSIVAVVDDDLRILGALEILLESADHAVRLFDSGAALLESGCLEEIDCLISDIGMPALDGLQLLRLVHEARPELPVILITGQLDVLNRPLPLSTSGHRLLTKPFDGHELLAAVNDALVHQASYR